jgi:hypothetical protein
MIQEAVMCGPDAVVATINKRIMDGWRVVQVVTVDGEQQDRVGKRAHKVLVVFDRVKPRLFGVVTGVPADAEVTRDNYVLLQLDEVVDALRFYADANNYDGDQVLGDGGKRAREKLKELGLEDSKTD